MIALRVSEVAISTNGVGWPYWVDWRMAHRPDRFTTVEATLAGEVVDVACDDREHAEWLMGFLLTKGVPARAMKVVGG